MYALATYPFYKILYKDFGVGTFVHPLASIGNHNLMSLGKNVEINHNVTIWGTDIVIHDNVQINSNTVIYGKVAIGKDSMIAPNCMIAGGNHNYDDMNIPMQYQGDSSKGITIEEDVWIGANCVILDGVVIHKGSIVGAGSVVTKDIEPYSIAFGNPCQIQRKRGSL